MKTGALWKISIETSADAEEAVRDLLERIFDVPASTHLEVESGALTVTIFLEKKSGCPRPQRPALLAALEQIRACGLDPAPARLAIRTLPPENWAESWKRHFKPIEVARQLVIQPSWSRRRSRSGQAVVVLDPGLSFGTGHHPTTAFCLRQIVRARPRGASRACLDIGCGSGILAISAAKLGYDPVEGFDIDPEAVRISRANAVQNAVRVRFYAAELGRLPRGGAGRFHLVCANLNNELLLAEHDRITGQVRAGGRLLLAGILEKEFQSVMQFYATKGFAMERAGTGGEWRSGVFRRAGPEAISLNARRG